MRLGFRFTEEELKLIISILNAELTRRILNNESITDIKRLIAKLDC